MNDDYQDRWDEARHYGEKYGYPVTPQILVNHFHAQELARSNPLMSRWEIASKNSLLVAGFGCPSAHPFPRSGMAELRAASLAKQFQLNPP